MMETLHYDPDITSYPDYDVSSNYNRLLYPGIQNIENLGHLGRSAIHAWTGMGRHMLRGARVLGMPPMVAEGWDVRLDALELITTDVTQEYEDPGFGIDEVEIDGKKVAVTEEIVRNQDRPFGSLVHYKRDTDRIDPKVLLFPPMAGHYPGLLEDTLRTMLSQGHDVYVAYWKNARDVPLDDGEFGLDTYTRYSVDFIKELGSDVNVVAVCQPTVPVVAAVSYLAQTEPESQPASMVLMGGPLDTRVKPTPVTKFAENHSIDWFRDVMTAKVPDNYPGAGRIVYPGKLQLASFLGMKVSKHIKDHLDLYENLKKGNLEDAQRQLRFNLRMRGVSDVPGPFYLQTVDQVFKQQTLAKRLMEFGGIELDPREITRPHVMTVEGDRDDISGPGQTEVLHEWLEESDPGSQFHFLQENAGHYAIFTGSGWRTESAPRITWFIRNAAGKDSNQYSPVPSGATIIRPDNWATDEHNPALSAAA